jgi:hypothetical protein
MTSEEPTGLKATSGIELLTFGNKKRYPIYPTLYPN